MEELADNLDPLKFVRLGVEEQQVAWMLYGYIKNFRGRFLFDAKNGIMESYFSANHTARERIS